MFLHYHPTLLHATLPPHYPTPVYPPASCVSIACAQAFKLACILARVFMLWGLVVWEPVIVLCSSMGAYVGIHEGVCIVSVLERILRKLFNFYYSLITCVFSECTCV